MKKGLLLAIVALAAIAIVASFGFQLGGKPPAIPESMAAGILFVCPMENSKWISVALGLSQIMRYIIGAFFFTAVLLLFGWGWQLYQNMLSDKFKRDSFKNIWGFTKIWFWALIIVMVLVYTPNSFRRVELAGASGNWVLCESNTPGAQAVHANAVHAR